MRSLDLSAFRQFLPSGSGWLYLLALLALVVYSSSAHAEAWRFVGAYQIGHPSATGGNSATWGYTIQAPPICRRNFATAAEALTCLKGARTDPYYVKDIGYPTKNTSAYGNFYEQYSTGLIATAITTQSATNFKCLEGVANSNCYRVTVNPESLDGGYNRSVVRLVDGTGAPLNNRQYDRYLFASNRNPANWEFIGDPSSDPKWSSFTSCNVFFCPFNIATDSMHKNFSFALARFPSEQPGNGGESCVGKFDYVNLPYSFYASFAGGKGPPIGTPWYDEDKLCDYDFTDIVSDAMVAAGHVKQGNACMPAFEGQPVMCVLVGVTDLSGSVGPRSNSVLKPSEVSPVNDGNPLVITLGQKTEVQGVMKEPTVAERILGWGQTLAPVTMGGSLLLGVIPTLVENWENGLEERQWKLYVAYMEEDLIDLVFGYDAYREVNGFYHPGNYDAAGNYIGAFDRDWGKTDYAPEKAFNWDRDVPATQVSKDMLEVVAKNPTTNRDSVITKPTYTGSTPIKYPPGVPGDDGTVTPPPTDGGDGDGGGWPSAGEWFGGYSSQGSLYTSAYPGGFSGVLSSKLVAAQEAAGVSEVIDTFTFTGSATSVGDVCYSLPAKFEATSVRPAMDFSSDLSRLCIPEYVIAALKALLIIGAGLYCRSLVFGG